MKFLKLLLRVLAPPLYGRIRALETTAAGLREALKGGAPPVAADKEPWEDPDWTFVASGGDESGHRHSSDDPKQCECGTDWNVAHTGAFYNNRPN